MNPIILKDCEDLYKEKIIDWSELDNASVLVTGACGMLPAYMVWMLIYLNEYENFHIHILALCRNAARAPEVFGTYTEREYFELLPTDVTEPFRVERKLDYLIHAASNTHPLQYSQDAIGTIASNVIGTTNLLNYAAAHDTERVCFLSSVEIYGENRGDVEKFDEAYLGYIDCNTLRAGYPESKRLGEALCNAYRHTHGLDFVVARLSRIYGPTMLLTDSKAIAQFIKKAAAGEDIILKSDGNQKYSYTYVTDAAAAIFHMLLRGSSGGAYNVADEGSDITLREMADYLACLAGSRVIFQLPNETERRGYSATTKGMLDASELKKLGWEPRVHIREGLLDTVESLRAQRFPI